MNKPVFYIAFLFCFCASFGNAQQNLVYNGDFEEYSECPVGFSDISQNPKEIEKCLGWNAPTHGTSDFYHICAAGTDVSIPVNPFGNQTTSSGNGYLGAYFTNYSGGFGTEWWEYVQGKLTQPLVANKFYKLSMEVSLAEYSDLMINEFGVFFSQYPISTSNTASLNLKPQCIFRNPDFFGDTLNWMHVESYFVAKGDEEFIIIGNFNNNLETDTLRRYNYEPSIENPYSTYLYMDKVVLVEAAVEFPNVFTPNGDAINDFWTFGIELPNTTIQIINRWGNVVATGSLENFFWDGRSIQGEECAEGTYFYVIGENTKTGFIRLVR